MQLVLFENGRLVESFNENTAVITAGQQSIVLELVDTLLNRKPTDPQRSRDRVTVDAVARAQLPRQHQVDNVI